MKAVGRFVTFLLVLAIAVVVIVAVGVRTEGGQELIRSRLASHLAMVVDFESARLVWPGALVLETFAVQVKEGDDVSVAAMKELQLSFRAPRRVVARLRRPDIVIRQSPAGDWQPSAFSPIPSFTESPVKALETFSEAFRERADIYIEDDGTIQFIDAAERAVLTLGGVRWHCVRVDYPGSESSYHQEFMRYSGTGFAQNEGRPERFEWFSAGGGLFVTFGAVAPTPAAVAAPVAAAPAAGVPPVAVAPVGAAPPVQPSPPAEPEPEAPAAAASREAA